MLAVCGSSGRWLQSKPAPLNGTICRRSFAGSAVFIGTEVYHEKRENASRKNTPGPDGAAFDLRHPDGMVRVYLTAGIGIAPTIFRLAREGVFVELNAWHGHHLMGIHDIYEIEDPWFRSPVLITHPMEKMVGAMPMPAVR